jgi:hypothetical protein
MVLLLHWWPANFINLAFCDFGLSYRTREHMDVALTDDPMTTNALPRANHNHLASIGDC